MGFCDLISILFVIRKVILLMFPSQLHAFLLPIRILKQFRIPVIWAQKHSSGVVYTNQISGGKRTAFVFSKMKKNGPYINCLTSIF